MTARDKAVEATARALYEAVIGTSWAKASAGSRGTYRARAEAALAAAAPILLAAERQRIAAAIRANHQRAYHLDSTAGPLCICGRLYPCPDAALAARIAETGL